MREETHRGSEAQEPKRRGRPPATDSAETRRSITDAARKRFATVGFHGTSVTAIAADLSLSATAIYHYVDNKSALYEAVMRETVELVWSGLLSAVEAETDVESQVEAFAAAADEYGADDRLLSAFLVAVPLEARRHPAFRPLVDLLAQWQARVFDAMATTGLRTGELASFPDAQAASQALHMLIIGWSFETHYSPEIRQARAKAVRHAVAAWRA